MRKCSARNAIEYYNIRVGCFPNVLLFDYFDVLIFEALNFEMLDFTNDGFFKMIQYLNVRTFEDLNYLISEYLNGRGCEHNVTFGYWQVPIM